MKKRGSRMKKRILVVEDEDKLRRVHRAAALSAGFDVDKAASAEEGLKVVRPRRPGAHRSQAAQHGRPAVSGVDPAAKRAGAGDRDDGLRQRRNRGGSHEGRRHGFPAQAVLARSPDAGGRQGARSARAARREPPAEGRAGPPLRVRQHHRPQPGHAGDLRHHRARGAHARHGAAGRRKRRRART